MSEHTEPATGVPAEHAALEASVHVDASPDRVWELVRDLRRMSRWSPQVVRTFVRGGGEVRQGSRLVNVNHKGLLVWPTQATVVRFEPGHEIAFRVKENYTIWSLTLEPEGEGTRLVQRREVPQGISDLSLRLTRTVLGGVDGFTDHLREGMQQTLAAIKVDAEVA